MRIGGRGGAGSKDIFSDYVRNDLSSIGRLYPPHHLLLAYGSRYGDLSSIAHQTPPPFSLTTPLPFCHSLSPIITRKPLPTPSPPSAEARVPTLQPEERLLPDHHTQLVPGPARPLLLPAAGL